MSWLTICNTNITSLSTTTCDVNQTYLFKVEDGDDNQHVSSHGEHNHGAEDKVKNILYCRREDVGFDTGPVDILITQMNGVRHVRAGDTRTYIHTAGTCKGGRGR